VLAAEDAPVTRVVALEAVGVEVVRVPGTPEERIVPALRALGQRGIQSLFVEGGAGLAGALLQAGAVDRVAWFLAPILIGGREAPSAIGGGGVRALADAPRLIAPRHETVGDDLLVTGRLRPLPVGA
jgi:diaminohydroxyphosphoribosylaminopyrimidine deaminase/5-amino-6-(5-phosphoribosylamino)uracil reductase